MILIIVESPAKCKKINAILGDNYYVKATGGHIRELIDGLKAIKIDNKFEPIYRNINGKSSYIETLHNYKNISDEVIIATDMDREGEAIGFHISSELNLDFKTTKRICFNEITSESIHYAIDNPRTLDINLFNAQKTRVILDRLIGYELSPLLWNKFDNNRLSAGRCQSPTLRLVCDKEEQIHNFSSKIYFETMIKIGTFNFTYNDQITDKKMIYDKLDIWQKPSFKYADAKHVTKKNKPSAPFITSTLQQDASNKLGIGSKECMSIAQELYEKGHITYMRTDSISLSDNAKNLFKPFIKRVFGDKYYEDHKFKTKVKNAQEAHEAIRPTTTDDLNDVLTGKTLKLYTLIFKRTIQSLMCSYETIEHYISINHKLDNIFWTNHISQPISIGFKIYDGWSQKTLDDKQKEFDKCMKNVQVIKKYTITVKQKKTTPETHYTEATLVLMLEKAGIGRPSTFANLVSSVQDKNYVSKQTIQATKINAIKIDMTNTGDITEENYSLTIPAEKNKLVPTELGLQVNSYLQEKFASVINYHYTEELEEYLDDIAKGDKQWLDVIKSFYDQFHPIVLNNSNLPVNTGRQTFGTYNGSPIVLKNGKYGEYIECGKIRVSCPTSINNREEALELLKTTLPLGNFEYKPIYVKNGRYGYYLQWDMLRISCTNNITIEDAITLIRRDKRYNN